MGLEDVDDIYQIEVRSHSHPWSKKLFLSNFTKNYFNHVLLEEGKIIGYFVANCVVSEVTLMNITIAPAYQGRGFGKQLLTFLKNFSISNNHLEIWLEVRESNKKAIALYQALNFVEVDRRKNYYPAGKHKEDAIIMCCYL